MRKAIIIIFSILLIINVAYVFAGVLFHPLQSIDAIGIWLFKAKAFYVEQSFPNHFLHTAKYAYSHQQYPLAVPFIFSLIYQILGRINEHAILIIYPIIYTLILILAYIVFHRYTNTACALIFVYIYSMLSPLVAAGGRILAGNADIFIVFIEWVIIFLLYKKSLKSTTYVLIMILVMIASQIKSEGVFLSAILLFLPTTWKTKITLFSISLFPFIFWMLVVSAFKIPADTYLIFPSIPLILERVAIIGVGIIKELGNINNWYILWVLVLLSISIKHKLTLQLRQVLLPAYFLMMFLYVLVYLFASNDTYAYINSSFDRVLLQHSAVIFLFFFEKMTIPFDRLLDIIDLRRSHNEK